jgi:hypothetical protein
VPHVRAVPPLRAPAGRDNRMRRALCVTAVAAACLAALASPGAASAHGRAVTVTLDYRLPLDPGVNRLHGVEASVIDGDRAIRLVVASGVRVIVLGDLGEPMLRFDDGVWVNESSPTAQANRLVKHARPGWKRIAGGHELTWHEHRLAPPPFVPGPTGRVAAWQIPLLVNGQRSAARSCVWHDRPSGRGRSVRALPSLLPLSPSRAGRGFDGR